MSSELLAVEPDRADVDAGSRGVAERGPVSVALRDVAPVVLSLVPFSLAIGATIAAADVDPFGALAGALVLVAGSAQLAVTNELDAGAGLVAAATTGILVNARFVLYSMTFGPWFAAEPRWRRALLVFPLVDQTFLLAQRRFDEHDELGWRRSYHLTTTAACWGTFAVCQVVGFAVGDRLPDELGLTLAAPMAFAALLALALTDRRSLCAGLGAAGALLILAGLPGGMGLPIAVVAGAGIGARVAERS